MSDSPRPISAPPASQPQSRPSRSAAASPGPGYPAFGRPRWGWLVGVIWLGGSLSLGWVVGLLVAQLWPAHSPAMPAQERLMRQASRSLTKLRQLPQWWQQEGALPSSGIASRESRGAPPSPTPGSSLNQPVEELQQTLDTWKSRLVTLEKQFNQPAVGTLEQRLTRLQQRVRQFSATAPVVRPVPPQGGSQVIPGPPPDRDPDLSPMGDRIVLPGLALFEPGSSTLTRSGQHLLATIQPDLRRYGPATVVVASHSQSFDRPEQARQLSFAQALAVRTYLAQQLPQAQFRWLVVGFGASRPLVVNQVDSQNRNQRIEIGIVQ